MARYQAFISYKHVASSRFAENLELAIKAYAKPWLRPPIAIFRDEKYLRPGIDLPGMIERALAESRFLIYLASPKAAASRWVQRELMRWCADPERLERLIIVLTDGTLETIEGGTTIDWERTDVLPAPLRNVLTEVPYYVDLAWAVDERMQSLLDPEFKNAVNAIVAALRQVDPVELSGEEIRQHRRNLRVRNGFVAAITLLAVGLGVSAGIVLDQRNEVLVQRDELLVQRNEVLVQRNAAEARAREATSRRLAAEADRLTEDRFDTALLLMAQAYRMGDNSALRASWWRLLGTRSRPALYLPESAVDGGFGLAGDLLLRTERSLRMLRIWSRVSASFRVVAATSQIWGR
jgi:hypothetical protein